MENSLVHEIELYPPESFEILLCHEVNRSRRYKSPLTLIHLAVETDVKSAQAQYGAEMFAINVLNLQVRETDIPCRRGNEFLVLMPATDEQGGRIVCERLEKLFRTEPQEYDKVSFKKSTFIGMASLPGDRALTSARLLEQASQALQHARTIRTAKAVVFSEI